jgi:hypothetical protein
VKGFQLPDGNTGKANGSTNASPSKQPVATGARTASLSKQRQQPQPQQQRFTPRSPVKFPAITLSAAHAVPTANPSTHSRPPAERLGLPSTDHLSHPQEQQKQQQQQQHARPTHRALQVDPAVTVTDDFRIAAHSPNPRDPIKAAMHISAGNVTLQGMLGGPIDGVACAAAKKAAVPQPEWQQQQQQEAGSGPGGTAKEAGAQRNWDGPPAGASLPNGAGEVGMCQLEGKVQDQAQALARLQRAAIDMIRENDKLQVRGLCQCSRGELRSGTSLRSGHYLCIWMACVSHPTLNVHMGAV